MRTGAPRSGIRFPRRPAIARLAGLLAAILLCASTGFGRRGRIVIDDPRRFPVRIGELLNGLPGAPVVAPGGERFLVFIGWDSDGTTSLFRADGTRGGTTAIGAPWPAGTWPGYSRLVSDGKVAWLLAPAEGGEGLYRCDGTVAGTELVTLTGATAGGEWQGPTPCGGRLFFTGRLPGAVDYTLFVSDGTPEGTHPVLPDGKPPVQSALVTSGSLVYFRGRTPAGGAELWRSDGTGAGTFPLGEFSGVGDPLPFGPGAVFVATQGEAGDGLWRTDGTLEGTRLVKDLDPGLTGLRPWLFGELDGKFLFAADDLLHGRALWATDGTEEGTSVLRSFVEDGRPGFPLGVLGGRFFFILNRDDWSTDLWSTDGTAEGTRLAVPDFPFQFDPPDEFHVLPGTGSAFLRGPRFDWEDFVVITDGTPEGTRIAGNAVGLQVWKGALYEVHSCCSFERVPVGAFGISESAVDDDGDGYSTEEEVALGSDWADPASRPPGAPLISEVQPLTVRSVSARLSILDNGTDTLRLEGTLPWGKGPSPEGRTVTLDAGGVIRTFTLDASGRSVPRGPESFRLFGGRAKDSFEDGPSAPFAMTLRRGSYAVPLADEGLWPDPVAAPATRTLPVTILLGGGTFRTGVPLEWRVEERGLGRARLERPR